MIALHTKPALSKKAYDLVLIYAFPLSSQMYDEAAEALQKERSDVAVHLIDLPGYGDAPYRERWTLAEAMESLHDALKEREIISPVIGGTSMGGYAVLAYAKLYPDEITGLILSNTKASGDDEAAKRNREIVAIDIEKRGHEAVYERMLDKLTSATTQNKRPEIKEQIRSWIAANDIKAIAATSRTLAVRDDSMDLLETIEVPALIIIGNEDSIIPNEESKKLTAIRNSHLEAVDGTGHLSAVEAPKQWADCVANFLTTLSESPI